MKRQNNSSSQYRRQSSSSIKNSGSQSVKQLRILDYRNGKYQGIVSGTHYKRNGLGILIDDKYSFVLSDWKQDLVEGPFFMIYPDQSILYGFIEKQNIGQMVSYQVNRQFNMILSKNTNTIIVDLLPSRTILTFKVDHKFLNQHTLQSILNIERDKDKKQQVNSSISMLSTDIYTNTEQKYKIYQKKLSLSNIPEYLKSYQFFIKQKFNKTDNQKDLIEVIKTRDDFSINFKKSATSLFLKLFVQNNQSKMLGSLNRYENNYQFYRKFIHSSNSIEQVIMKGGKPISFQYNLRPNNRPKRCQIELLSLHNSSVTFVNQFLNLNYMYRIKQNLNKINQLINYYANNKFAQVQLQNSRYMENEQQQKKEKKEISIPKYSLSEVQQQIYDAVRRKQNSTGKKPFIGNKSRRVSQNQIYYNKSFQYTPVSQNKSRIVSNRNNNSPYIRALHNNQNFQQSRLIKSKSNLNITHTPRTYDQKGSAIKNLGTNTKISQGTSNKKYAYLDDMENQGSFAKISKTPVKYQGYQNIRRLTEDYQIIKKQIQLNTPKNKVKRGPYRLDNQIYQSRSRADTMYNIQNRNKYTPSSQKKVFRYVPS